MSENRTRLYAELIEQSPDPIITLDLTGMIRFVNSATEDASAYSAAELVGKHFTKTGVLTAVGTVKAVQEFVLVVAGQTRPPFELEIIRKDGIMRTFEAHPKLIKTEDGGLERIQVIFRDVTNRKELEEALRKKSVALEQLTRLMTDHEKHILDLKREVNELLKQLGRAQKYTA